MTHSRMRKDEATVTSTPNTRVDVLGANAEGARPVTHEEHHRIEQFLFAEAALLDAGRLEEWAALFTDDGHYEVPVRETLDAAREDPASQPVSIFDADTRFLRLWHARLGTGLAHAEDPPSRTRHFISNVRATRSDAGYHVDSCTLVYVSRLDVTEAWYVGRRADELVDQDGQLRIRHRRTILDQRVAPRSISVFL